MKLIPHMFGYPIGVEENDAHYHDRRPGPMHPDDEARTTPC